MSIVSVFSQTQGKGQYKSLIKFKLGPSAMSYPMKILRPNDDVTIVTQS